MQPAAGMIDSIAQGVLSKAVTMNPDHDYDRDVFDHGTLAFRLLADFIGADSFAEGCHGVDLANQEALTKVESAKRFFSGLADMLFAAAGGLKAAAPGKAATAATGKGTAPAAKTAGKTGGLTAADANAPHIVRGNRPPYAAGTRARDIVLQQDRVFVRVHCQGNKARSWMMRPDEIRGLSAQQIKDKFALPELPSSVSDVHVPAGTRIRVGTAGAQEGWGSGGGIQYELLERLPESAFRNTRELP